MSGSLTRLVLRAQGLLPVAEPLLPSRFASSESFSAAIEEAETETPVSDPAAGPAPALLDADVPARDVPPSAETHHSRPSPPSSLPMSWEPSAPEIRPAAPASPIRRDQPSPPSAAAAIEVSDELLATPAPALPLVSRGADAAGAPGEAPAEMSSAEPSHAAPLVPRARIEAGSRQPVPEPRRAVKAHGPATRRPPAVPFAPLATEPLEGARATFVAPVAAASARAPDVQISIGRGEVHAAPSRAAPVRAAPARRLPLSLADYLARRK